MFILNFISIFYPAIFNLFMTVIDKKVIIYIFVAICVFFILDLQTRYAITKPV